MSPNPGVPYGPHFIADIPGCDPTQMIDGEFCYRFLQTLVRRIGMNPIGSPHLDLYSGDQQEWNGWSGTIHIQTSHVTAHFFAFGYVFLDVFSCRPFDLPKTQQFILDTLRPQATPRFQRLDRGYNFPPHLIHPVQLAGAAEVVP